MKELDHPTVGKVKVVGPPVTYSYAENCVRSPPPLLGQHTDEILQNLLDLSDKEINELKTKKIIQ